jgi:parvulin-like peptidyl-prolyl isomerase
LRLNHRLAIIIMVVLALAPMISGCSGEEGNDTAVSIVNGEEITREAFDSQINMLVEMFKMYGMEEPDEETLKQMEEMVMEKMISELLLLQAAEKADLVVNEQEVDDYIKEFEEQFEDDEEFEEYLSAFGLTRDSFVREVEKGLLIDLYVQSSFDLEEEISDEELREYYEENKNFFGDLEFEEVKDSLRDQMLSQKLQEHEAKLIEELRDNAEIEILI